MGAITNCDLPPCVGARSESRGLSHVDDRIDEKLVYLPTWSRRRWVSFRRRELAVVASRVVYGDGRWERKKMIAGEAPTLISAGRVRVWAAFGTMRSLVGCWPEMSQRFVAKLVRSAAQTPQMAVNVQLQRTH